MKTYATKNVGKAGGRREMPIDFASCNRPVDMPDPSDCPPQVKDYKKN